MTKKMTLIDTKHSTPEEVAEALMEGLGLNDPEPKDKPTKP